MELDSTLDRLKKYEPIDKELMKAEKKWPNWPSDINKQALIMLEEAGEVAKAVLHLQHEGGSIKEVREELTQTAAMCMRMLKNLENTGAAAVPTLTAASFVLPAINNDSIIGVSPQFCPKCNPELWGNTIVQLYCRKQKCVACGFIQEFHIAE